MANGVGTRGAAARHFHALSGRVAPPSTCGNELMQAVGIVGVAHCHKNCSFDMMKHDLVMKHTKLKHANNFSSNKISVQMLSEIPS
jgi:hypothetical protein